MRSDEWHRHYILCKICYDNDYLYKIKKLYILHSYKTMLWNRHQVMYLTDEIQVSYIEPCDYILVGDSISGQDMATWLNIIKHYSTYNAL